MRSARGAAPIGRQNGGESQGSGIGGFTHQRPFSAHLRTVFLATRGSIRAVCGRYGGGVKPVSIAVVIPLFNGSRHIEETLQTVLAQELAPSEIVVVDDASEDDGPSLAARFEGVRVVPSARKKRARHTGLLETSAELVAFLDHDDLWHPAHLRRLSSLLSRHPDAPAAASGWRLFLSDETPRLSAEPVRDTPIEPWLLWPARCPIPTPSAVLFRREALLDIGGWAVEAAPDWEVYLRLTDPRVIISLGAKTCGYRLHANARSTTLRRDGWAYLELLGRGADASLEERLARGDVDEALRERLHRRRRLFDHLTSIMRGVRMDDPAQAADAARALDRDVEAESATYVDTCFEMLVYVFCPGHEHAAFIEKRDELLAELEHEWPEDAARTGRILRTHRRRHRFRWRRYLRAVLKGRLGDARRQWRARQG